MWHAFLDESRRGPTYLVAVVIALPRDLDRIRTALRAKVKPGQRRLHFYKEGESRRRAILSLLDELGVRARIFTCEHPSDRAARQACLRAAGMHLINISASRLVLESCAHQDAYDRHTMALVKRKIFAINYEHFRAHEDPMLWASDAIAWSYGAGGEWRRRVAGLVEGVKRVEAA
ncbi:hypothetical protein ACFFSW_32835 [Saccharothrix longispora]|uniref:DUF3800 domain-containing protein n=1 Tax=Saccharothrix longispora TaxID=33920 RepID=A0ABU1Q1Z5_9PSEU|nr:hypothetical protein [Saccharothrix longispora]MDR6596935.1 hypothetical protein [Saccharothrix longispora]